jgi:hypothetical protein
VGVTTFGTFARGPTVHYSLPSTAFPYLPIFAT